MKDTGLAFYWAEKESKNGAAVRLFESNGIRWEYSHLGELFADVFGIGLLLKVGFEPIGGDWFRILFDQKYIRGGVCPSFFVAKKLTVFGFFVIIKRKNCIKNKVRIFWKNCAF